MMMMTKLYPLVFANSDRIRTAVNVLSDGYVSGIVAHLSKDELAKYDAEQGGRHPELGGQGQLPGGLPSTSANNPTDSQGKCRPLQFAK